MVLCSTKFMVSMFKGYPKMALLQDLKLYAKNGKNKR
jgi:hypothetical protein